MFTSNHPETDGQTKRTNRILEEILRGYVHSFTNWSELLPMMEFSINNSVDASTTHTPLFVNGLHHPRLPTFLECESRFKMRETHSSDRQSGSHSSSAKNAVTTMLTSALVKKTKVRAKMLLLATVLIKSASRLVRPKTRSQRRQVILLQYAPRALQIKIASQQMNSYWLAKRLSVSYKTLSQRR